MVESALEELTHRGHEVLAAVLAGGREKLPAGGVDAYGRFTVKSGEDARQTLHDAIAEYQPDAVMDLSDEPVLDYRRRFGLASVALAAGVPYQGADFDLTPPARPTLAEKPSLAIIGTGKRTGKTAVAGFTARTLVSAGHHPVIVAMGRGGPAEPEVLRGDLITLEPEDLLALADAGKHAASDYIEDAFLGRVPTVGCRRCGGGLGGGVDISNVGRGVEVANGIEGDLLLFEGSGSAIPPVKADVTGLIIPASIPPEYVEGYLGPLRLLLADFVVVTMCEEPFGSPSKISSLTSLIEDAWRPRQVGGNPKEDLRVVRTVFRPAPTRPVDGSRVFVATTAPEAAGGSIKDHLESEHGCTVVGVSHSLSDRARLEEELKALGGGVDILLCEIKAAAVDVATKRAMEAGLEVIYMDNIPMGVGGDDMTDVVTWAGELARARFGNDL